jgi:hypothetical protein
MLDQATCAPSGATANYSGRPLGAPTMPTTAWPPECTWTCSTVTFCWPLPRCRFSASMPAAHVNRPATFADRSPIRLPTHQCTTAGIVEIIWKIARPDVPPGPCFPILDGSAAVGIPPPSFACYQRGFDPQAALALLAGRSPKSCRTLRLFGKHSFVHGFDCRDCPMISGDRPRRLFVVGAYYGQSAGPLPGMLHLPAR